MTFSQNVDRAPHGGRGFVGQLVVVASQLPVVPEPFAGTPPTAWRRSPDGIVTTLEPVVRAEGGHWVGTPDPAWPEGPPEAVVYGGVRLHPVPVSRDEMTRYHEGFANSTIWPLYHDLVEQPRFRQAWWQAYVAVNERFAAAVAQIAPPRALIWVQEHHLQLVPAMLRERRPDLRIGFFLHIPVPSTEVFARLPQRAEVLRGLLGADLLGFQQPKDARGFLRLVYDLLGLRASGWAVRHGGRRVRVSAFPASIDTAAIEGLAVDPDVRKAGEELRRALGEPRTVIVGVDRLDYTKGIGERLVAFRSLLAERRLPPGDAALVQLAVPSHEGIDAYRELRQRVEYRAAEINAEYGRLGHPVVHYIHQTMTRDELVALYLAADVMAVTPLRDGMNLVAKEYVAARVDGGGALVLSEFAGSAAELGQAYLVNPFDVRGLADALYRAAFDDPAGRARRMAAMRAHVTGHDAYRWGRRFLTALRATPRD
jgi:trehalose 6-phosphate synthase